MATVKNVISTQMFSVIHFRFEQRKSAVMVSEMAKSCVGRNSIEYNWSCLMRIRIIQNNVVSFCAEGHRLRMLRLKFCSHSNLLPSSINHDCHFLLFYSLHAISTLFRLYSLSLSFFSSIQCGFLSISSQIDAQELVLIFIVLVSVLLWSYSQFTEARGWCE